MTGTRQRIIGATAVLMRRQGYEATGMKEIVTAASAPFGSVYHFFPGGKEQLGAETIRWSGAEYAKLLAVALDSSPDLAGGVRAFFEGAAEHLVATGYATPRRLRSRPTPRLLRWPPSSRPPQAGRTPHQRAASRRATDPGRCRKAYQRPRCTTSWKVRRLGLRTGASGRPAG